MTILASWNLHDSELYEGILELLDMGELGHYLGVSSLVGALELVEKQMRIRAYVQLPNAHLLGE